MRTLTPTHKSSIALRKSQAHMYAAGFNDALRGCETYQKVDELEFSRYFEELAIDYYSEKEVYMPSIPAAFEMFSGAKINNPTKDYDTCINCGKEVTDPTNPNEKTKYVHLGTLKELCNPDDLGGAMAREQRNKGVEYSAFPTNN